MVNYQLGKIYKIVCKTTGQQYIGSTCEPTLARRLAGHRGAYNQYLKGNTKYTTSFIILEQGNYEIILIELYPCDSCDELFSREKYHIQTSECVNNIMNHKIVPRPEMRHRINLKGFTADEMIERIRQQGRERQMRYQEDNREIIKERRIMKKAELKTQTAVPLPTETDV